MKKSELRQIIREEIQALNERKDPVTAAGKSYRDKIDIKNRDDMRIAEQWFDSIIDQNYSDDQLSTRQVGDLWDAMEKAMKRKTVENYEDVMEFIFDNASRYGNV